MFVFLFSVIVAYQLLGESLDYANYVDIFSDTKHRIEPIWMLLRLSKLYIGFSLPTLFFFTTFFSLQSKFNFYYESCEKYYLFLIASYIFTYFWIHEYTQFRVTFALATFVYSYKIQDNKIKLLLMFCVCLLMHYSCIVLFPLLFFLNFKKKGTYVIIPVSLFIIAILFSNRLRNPSFWFELFSRINMEFFTVVIMAKLGNTSDFTVFNKLYLFLFILFITSYYTGIKNRREPDRLFYFCFKLTSYSLSLFYFFALTPFPVMAFRFSEFFLPFSLVLLIKNIDYIKEKYIYLIFIFIYIFMVSLKMLTSTGRL